MWILRLSNQLYFCLTNSRSYCVGDIKTTNWIRTLVSCITKGTVPTPWLNLSAHTVGVTVPLAAWIADLSARIRGLDRYKVMLASPSTGLTGQFWLGGMFSPESFITAIRQQTAQVMINPFHAMVVFHLICSLLLGQQLELGRAGIVLGPGVQH